MQFYENGKFIWRVTYSHVIAYFVAGILALNFMNYETLFATEPLSFWMKPIDSAIIALAPSLQIIRGMIIALVLLPLKKAFVEDRRGFLKLALLIYGLSSISTIAAAPESFEGIVYTKLPLHIHLLGLPETMIYVSLFCLLLWISYRLEKKYVFIISVISVGIIALLSIAGYLSRIGILKA